MNDFGMVRAWGLGYRLLAERPFQYAALLIGLGLLAPGVAQYAGGAMAGEAAFGQGTEAAMDDATSAIAVIGLIIAYVFQNSALFGVLRLGLGERERMGPALLFGLLASLVVISTAILLFAIVAMVIMQSGPPGLAPFIVLGAALPIILGMAAWTTLLAALIGVGVVVMLSLMMAVGAATGNVEMAATVVGGSGLVVVMLIILGAVLVWLAARLSCTAAFMADHKRLNPIAAIRASWELTRDDQGRITLYLALLGFALGVLLIAVLGVIGGSAAMLEGVAEPGTAEIGALILFAILAAPFAFLAVLVPAGIYLHLAGERAPVDVFA